MTKSNSENEDFPYTVLFCLPSTGRIKGNKMVKNRIVFNRLRADAENLFRKITFLNEIEE